jgi:hypothetical protein
MGGAGRRGEGEGREGRDRREGRRRRGEEGGRGSGRMIMITIPFVLISSVVKTTYHGLSKFGHLP